MSTISTVNVPQIQPVGQPTTTETNRTTDRTGTGTISQTGPVPPTEMTAIYGSVLQSLRSMTPGLSSSDVSVLVAEIAQKLKDIQQISDKDKVAVESNEKRAHIAEKRDKLEESIKKLKEAEAAGMLGIFAIFKAIFDYIIAALTMIVPGLNVLTALNAADSWKKMLNQTGALKSDGFGVMGSIVKALGGSDEDAGKGDMGFGMTMAGLQVIGSVALTIATAGGGGGVAAMNIVKAVENAYSIVNTIIDLGSAASDLAKGIIQSDATKAKADGKKLQAVMEMLDEVIDQAIARMLAAGDRFNQILDNTMEAMNDRGRTLAQSKFTG